MSETPKSAETFKGSQPETWAERRKDPRLHCIGWAEVNLISGHPLFEGRVHNLSSSGCRVWSREVLHMLPGCEVEIVLDVDGIRFRVRGALRSENRVNGFGIEFLELSPRCRQYIDDLIQELAFYQRPKTLPEPTEASTLSAGEPSATEPADQVNRSEITLTVPLYKQFLR